MNNVLHTFNLSYTSEWRNGGRFCSLTNSFWVKAGYERAYLPVAWLYSRVSRDSNYKVDHGLARFGSAFESIPTVIFDEEDTWHSWEQSGI